MAKQHSIFIPIHKIDEERRLVYGIATEELPDKQGEICDYNSSKPFYEKWSSDIEKATDGKSKGNLRVMHGNKVAGTIPQITFNDDAKQIEICAKVIDNDEWKMVLAGGYTGFSQGGSYEKKWKDGDFMRYTSNPCEISLVDNPCLSTATFEVLKSDGTIELRKFQTLEQNTMTKNTDNEIVKSDPIQGWQASDGSFHVNKAAAVAHNEELEKKAKESDDANDTKTKEDTGKDGNDEQDGKGKTKENKEKDNAAKADAIPKEGIEKTVVENTLSKYLGDNVYDASAALEALCIVMGIFSTESFEAKFEGENEPGQLADLKIVIDKLKSFISSEIMEKEQEDGVMQMSDKGDLEKAGAKLSAMSKSHLDKMYKSAKGHMDTMDECMKSMGAMDAAADDKDKADKAAQDELVKSARASLEKEELQKKLEDKHNAELQKVSDTINALQKRIDLLELQPAEPKGSKLVLKDHESEIGNSSSVEDSIIKGIINRNGESPMVLAEEIMKAIQAKKQQ